MYKILKKTGIPILTGLIGVVIGISMTILLMPFARNFTTEISFDSTDKDQNNVISKEEFRHFLLADAKNKAARSRNTTPNPVSGTKSVSQTSFDSADIDRNGNVSKEEFRAFLIGNAAENSALKQESSPQFNVADENKDGTVSKEEFQKYLLVSASSVTETAGMTCGEAGHADCPLQDMPEEVCCMSGFEWKNGNEKFAYKGPSKMIASADGKTIFIANRDAAEVVVLDTVQNKIVQTLPVGKEPNSLVLSSDEKIIYVTSGGYNGRLQAVDLDSGNIINETVTGHTPQGLVLLPDGKRIFVCNRFNASVTEYHLPEMTPVRHIKTIREPCGAVASKDGTKIFVLNFLPNDPNNFPDKPHEPVNVASSVTVIDTVTGNTEHLRLPNGSCNLTDICLSPDGRYVYLTHILSRFYNVTDHLENGWMNANGMSIINTENNQLSTVLLDDPESGAANPWGITTSSDGKQIFVAIAGTDEMIVLDAEAMHKKLTNEDGIDFSNDLSFLAEAKRRIKLTGKGAREIVSVGQKVYVTMYYDDSLRQIDLSNNTVTKISFGTKTELTQERAGEMYWNDATLCQQQWQSCASCHSDGRMTGMNWDLLHDGEGNPKNTKSLVLSHETPPTMWLGDRRHAMQCTRTGFRFILFTMPQRDPCFTIDEYTRNMKPLPSPYLVNGQLSDRAKRGKTIFEKSEVGCTTCHPAPLFTDMKMYDVGSEDQFSAQKTFDTPTLVEVWRTAPYFHDGRYVEMKDVFKKGKHGNIENLSDEEIDDLVEYVLSL